MIKFDQNHLKWAAKVIEEITPEAVALNRDFYPLQSPIRQNPKVLFLGLNPGGGHTYESQSEKWNFVPDDKNPGKRKMTPETLLMGNPFFNANSEDWKYIQGLKKIAPFREVLESGDFVLANYYYISTANFNETSGQSAALEKCKRLTYELIEMIQPELIVILGTRNGLDLLDGFSDKKVLLSGRQRLLISAKFGGIRTLAIPHPSRILLNEAELNALNTNISEIINNQTLTPFKELKSFSASDFEISGLEKELQKRGLSPQFTISDNGKYFDWTVSNNDNAILIRLDKGGKALNFRDAKAGTSGAKDRFHSEIKNSDTLEKSIQNISALRTNSWFMQKYFTAYDYQNLDDLYAKLAEDISGFYKVFTS